MNLTSAFEKLKLKWKLNVKNSQFGDWQVKTVSMLKFRSEAETILSQVGRGQSFILTYRGKPIARLEPIGAPEISDDDPIYQLASLASQSAEPITNKDMDRLIYGS